MQIDPETLRGHVLVLLDFDQVRHIIDRLSRVSENGDDADLRDSIVGSLEVNLDAAMERDENEI